jgi:hypothetical protein
VNSAPRTQHSAPRAWNWFFPAEPRHLPGNRALSVALRTVHLAGFGLLLGGHAFGAAAERLLPALYLTIGSGIGLIALEVHALGLPFFVMAKGALVLLKAAVLLLVPLWWEQRVPLLLLVVILGSVGSHMPGRYRHAMLVPGRPRRDGAGPGGEPGYRATAATGRS